MSYNQESCTSCGKLVQPNENAVHFACPSCGDVMVWRCERCRRFARAYDCPKCGFHGP